MKVIGKRRIMRRSTQNFNIPPPPFFARAFELLKIGSFKFPPRRAKMVFNALPYRRILRICLSYPIAVSHFGARKKQLFET